MDDYALGMHPHAAILAMLAAILSACSSPSHESSASQPVPEHASPKVAKPAAELAGETSVKPGINKSFLDPELDVQQYVQRFETESREIFTKRAQIARAVGIQRGMTIADIGAGTGLFLEMFAKDVGDEGKVYAVDISEKFVANLRDRAGQKHLQQVEVVQCTEKSAELPANAVDIAFVCDTYHHFEYPQNTLASIHRALRPGGKLVIVDFERIEGVSRQWLLDHVRAGKAVFRQEVVDAGFAVEEEVAIEGLQENYFLRFRKL